ncbi:MAG: replication-relaxation family protein [Chloroflexota bacterium]
MAARTSIVITRRDVASMVMIHTYDGCLVQDIWRRFYPSSGARAAVYTRLQRLAEAGYLARHQLPALYGRGSGRTFLTLGPKGRQMLAEHLELPRTELKRLRELTAPLLGAHHGAINAFRVSLELACESAAVHCEWTNERELRNPPTVRIEDPQTHALVALIHDGVFRLTLAGGLSQDYALEMDMGTMAPKRMRSKLRAALLHGRDDPKPVLYIVPDRPRADLLSKWTIEEAGVLDVDPSVIWISCRDDIDEHCILTPCWQVVGVAEPQSLVPDGVAS